MKALGIIALVLAVVAIFTPVNSFYVVWLAFSLASIAAFSRDALVFALLTSLIGAINIVLISPLPPAAFANDLPIFLMTVILGAVPVAIAVRRIVIALKPRSTVKVLRT